MSEIPPLRVTQQGGGFNQIPVFEMEFSGATLSSLSPTKIRLTTAGAQGPSGPAGVQFTVPLIVNSGGTGLTTIGSAHTILGVNSSEASLTYYAILASNNLTVTKVGTSIFITALTASISGKQDSLTIPLIVTSGGTGRNVAGSATLLIGMNTSGVVYDYYALLASDNATVVRSGTAYFISAITNAGGSSVVYAATGNKYAVLDFAGDLTNEFRIVQSGNSITVDTTGNLVIINAVTGNLSTKQDTITFPLSVASGGTARTTAGSSHTLLGVNSDGTTLSYYAILASDNTTIVKSGTGIFISATTNAGGGSGSVSSGTIGRIAFYPQTGTNVDDLTIGSAMTLIGVNSSEASHQYFIIQASNNATITYSGSSIFVSATTAAGGGSGTVQSGSGNAITFYPSNGTTVSSSTIFINTGNGIASFNLSILTSNAASAANGDSWFQSSSNLMYLFMRSNNSNYFVAMNT